MSTLTFLRQRPAFGMLWTARSISFLGDTVATTALVLFVHDRIGTGVAVGGLLLAQTLPRLFGPLAGALVDRVEQRRLMIACDLGQTLIFGLIALLLPPLPVLLLLVTVAASLATLFAPAGRSIIPSLVGANELPTANGLLALGINLSLALGPAIGGVLSRGIGYQNMFALNALSFLLSAILLSRLPHIAPASVTGQSQPGFLATTSEGLQYLRHHRVARAVGIGLFLTVAFAALDNVALVFLAQDVFRAGPIGFGLLASAHGIGMVVAPLLLLRWTKLFPPRPMLLLSLLLMGGGTLATGLAPLLVIAVAGQLLTGIGNGLQNVANDLLVQRTVARQMLGRVFGTVYAGASLAATLTYSAGGALLEVTAPRVVFVIAGCGLGVTLLLLWSLLPRVGDTSVSAS